MVPTYVRLPSGSGRDGSAQIGRSRTWPLARTATIFLVLMLAAVGVRSASGLVASADRELLVGRSNATGTVDRWGERNSLRTFCSRSANHQQRCIFHSHPSCRSGRRPQDVHGAFSMPSGADMCAIRGSQCPTQRQLGYHGACDPAKGSTVLLPWHPKAVLTVSNMYWTDACDLVTRCAALDAEKVLAAMLRSGFHTISSTCQDVVQCIHHPGSVSRGWIHMHTVCSGGCVDGFPGTGGEGPSVGNGWCTSGRHSSETKANQLYQWMAGACQR